MLKRMEGTAYVSNFNARVHHILNYLIITSQSRRVVVSFDLMV
jgi:hypothetical protein